MNDDLTDDALAQLVRATFARAAQLRHVPESTYRVQLHKGFGFRDAAAIVPYLAEMGITHLYTSPYLKAVPGSMHGYDVIDQRMLNPELGTEGDYDALLATLKQHGMSHVLDTVPNHMGVATNENVFWNDVLENGPASRYADHFDITWNGSPRASLRGRLLLPLLGSHYGEALEKGELKLTYANGAFAIRYYDWVFPIAPETYGTIVGSVAAQPQAADLMRQIESLPVGDNAQTPQRHEQKEAIKQHLRSLVEGDDAIRQHVEQVVAAFNGTPGDPVSFDQLDRLLARQHYRPAYWKTAPDEINYRRFFDVNALAALAMEKEQVFRDVHAFTLELLADGRLAGLRVDHPDGLYDPAAYFRRLQSHYLLAVAKRIVQDDAAHRAVPWGQIEPRLLPELEKALPPDGGDQPWPLYVLGEKILAMDEPLPRAWALHGTSGYDFLNMANGLFVDGANAGRFTAVYESFIGQGLSFADLTYEKKKLILQISLASELHMLAVRLDELAQRDRRSADFTFGTLQRALTEVIACFPVYRSYISGEGDVTEVDASRIAAATDAAVARNPSADAAVFHFIRDTLLLRFGGRFTPQDRADQRRFAGKFQQLTSPTTAKGIEDTAFYIYNRLLSLNEVGGEPAHFGVSPEALHRYLAQRQREWPLAMSTLSTHDTKRSEDVRARLNVLSELPDQWQRHVQTWAEMNAGQRTEVAGRPAPDRNDEYAIYQTLVGASPMQLDTSYQRAEWEARVQQYMVKALREAKVHTGWTTQNADYEAAVERFVHRILDESTSREFLQSLGAFGRTIGQYGILNSLSQSLLKLTAPGVPDTYQGTEQWDLSLVDPDNRRPVDYARRRDALARLGRGGEARAKVVAELLATAEDGRIKQYVHLIALQLRRAYAGLFTHGDYLPLTATGPRAEHLFAFARHHKGRLAITAVPRRVTGLCGAGEMPLGERAWSDTMLVLPQQAASPGQSFRNVLTDERVTVNERSGSRSIPAGRVFKASPVALLVSDDV